MNFIRRALVRKSRGLTGSVMRLRQERHADRRDAVVRLEDVRRRLELLLTGVYGRDMQIGAIEAPAHDWIGYRMRKRMLDMVDRTAPHLRARQMLATNDGRCILLPGEIASTKSGVSAYARYRLLALGQAERVVRGTARHAPSADEPLERDLYLLCESVAVDYAIAHAINGLLPAMAAARNEALALRPGVDRMAPMERDAELRVRRVLGSNPAQTVPGIVFARTPADSLAWARQAAAAIRASSAADDRYRGTAPVPVWGTLSHAVDDPTDPTALDLPRTEHRADEDPSNTAAERGKSKRRKHTPSYSAPASSQLMRQVERENGLQRELSPRGKSKADTDIPDDSEDGGDGPESELHSSEDAGNERRTQPSRETQPAASATSETARPDSDSEAVEYPEWDCYSGRYRSRGATVRVSRHAAADQEWARAALRERAVLVRRVRERFERLRSHRVRLKRQRDGEELDIAACVDALVDRRAGRTPDDRLYVSVRPGRRALAITLLVDVSGSTDAQLSDSLQVVDVEKLALLLASEAFDALGDDYAILTFSSMGEDNVDVSLIKDFAERNGDDVRRRISAIAPGGNTRLGAAVRYASGLLAAQPAGHRLLLILSDGKPNDTDRYFEKYAVEDTRQAVIEARAQSVFPFCLTVDAHEPEKYLSHIFGPTGHTILRRPDQLPMSLLHVVRRLLGEHPAT